MSSMQVFLMQMLLHITAAASTYTVQDPYLISADDYVNDNQRSTKSSASIERFPFIVALINATSGSKTPLCTGSIVSSDVVLTSGFCTKYKLAVNDIAVIAGAESASEFENATASATSLVQRQTVLELHTHPKFKSRPVRNNLGVVRVYPFVFNSHINKIRISIKPWPKPKKGSSRKYAVKKCITAGWGEVFPTEEMSNSLRTRTVNARHGDRACTCASKKYQRYWVCAPAKTDGSLCYGSSGGPLVCNERLAGVWSSRMDDCKANSTVDCKSPNAEIYWDYLCEQLEFLRRFVETLPRSCKAPKRDDGSSSARNIPGSFALILGFFSQKAITAINWQP